MFNPLPLLALAGVAAGYAGAIHHDPYEPAKTPLVAMQSYPAASPANFQNLSVTNLVRRTGDALAENEPNCQSSTNIVATLKHDFGENRRDSWVQAKTLKMELWASDEMGTWTLVQHDAGGIACVLSSGIGWRSDSNTNDILALNTTP